MKCHNVFHTSLLKRSDFFSDNSPTPFSMHPHQYVLKAFKPSFSVGLIMGHMPHTAECLGETKRYLIWWAGCQFEITLKSLHKTSKVL